MFEIAYKTEMERNHVEFICASWEIYEDWMDGKDITFYRFNWDW